MHYTFLLPPPDNLYRMFSPVPEMQLRAVGIGQAFNSSTTAEANHFAVLAAGHVHPPQITSHGF